MFLGCHCSAPYAALQCGAISPENNTSRSVGDLPAVPRAQHWSLLSHQRPVGCLYSCYSGCQPIGCLLGAIPHTEEDPSRATPMGLRNTFMAWCRTSIPGPGKHILTIPRLAIVSVLQYSYSVCPVRPSRHRIGTPWVGD